jgi:hypothetical protein
MECLAELYVNLSHPYIALLAHSIDTQIYCPTSTGQSLALPHQTTETRGIRVYQLAQLVLRRSGPGPLAGRL